MSLTDVMVINYLEHVHSLKEIDHNEVKDAKGSKTGQTLITIQVGKNWIDCLLKEYKESELKKITEQEMNALFNLRKALDTLPTSVSIKSFMSAVTELDSIQRTLLDSVTTYLKNITQIDAHKLILKGIVLLLHITEYDLSKKEGPINIGFSFFKFQILSNEQRIENLSKVRILLNEINEQFDKYYLPKQTIILSSVELV